MRRASNAVFEDSSVVLTDEETRTIHIAEDIVESLFPHFLDSLTLIDQTPGDISLIITSTGGSSMGGLAYYDAIRGTKNHVITKVYGPCYSAAGLIFQAGDYRLMSPESRLMIHNVSIETAEEKVSLEILESWKDEMKYDNDRYISLYAQRTGIPAKRLAKMFEDETYYTARQAVNIGFADGIMKSRTWTHKK